MKEKAPLAYGKQYKGQCSKNNKYGPKLSYQKCLENKGEGKDENMNIKQSYNEGKKKAFDASVFNVDHEGTEFLTVKSLVRK